MWGSIISSAVGLGSQIFGGIQAARQRRKIKDRIDEQRAENQNWYDRRYNEDATQRADAQRLLSMTEETIRQQNRNTAGTQAVMGGTNASVAAAKAQNNNAIADAASRIAAAGEARKDRVEDSYRSRNQELDDQLTSLDNSKMSALSQATQAAGATLGSVGSSIDDWFDTRTGLPKDKVGGEDKEKTTA